MEVEVLTSDITTNWKIKIILWPTPATSSTNFSKICESILKECTNVDTDQPILGSLDTSISNSSKNSQWKTSCIQMRMMPLSHLPSQEWSSLYIYANVFGIIIIHSPSRNEAAEYSSDTENEIEDPEISSYIQKLESVTLNQILNKHPIKLIRRCFYFEINPHSDPFHKKLTESVWLFRGSFEHFDFQTMMASGIHDFAVEIYQMIANFYTNPTLLFHDSNALLSSSSKTKPHDPNNFQGRFNKMKADLLLLCGDPLNALTLYTNALEFSRNSNDQIWKSAEIEGQAAAILLYLLRFESEILSNKLQSFTIPSNMEAILSGTIYKPLELHSGSNSINQNIKISTNLSSSSISISTFEAQRLAILESIFNILREALIILNQDSSSDELFLISAVRYCRLVFNYIEEPAQSSILWEIFEIIDSSRDFIKIQFYSQIAGMSYSMNKYRKFAFYLQRLSSIYFEIDMPYWSHLICTFIAPYFHLGFLKLPTNNDPGKSDKSQFVTFSSFYNQSTWSNLFSSFLKGLIQKNNTSVVSNEVSSNSSSLLSFLNNNKYHNSEGAKLLIKHTRCTSYNLHEFFPHSPTLQSDLLERLKNSAVKMNDSYKAAWYNLAYLVILYRQMDLREQRKLISQIELHCSNLSDEIELPISLVLLTKEGYYTSSILRNLEHRLTITSDQQTSKIHLGGLCSGYYMILPIFESITASNSPNDDPNENILVYQQSSRLYDTSTFNPIFLKNPFEKNKHISQPIIDKPDYTWSLSEVYNIDIEFFNPLETAIEIEDLSLISGGVNIEELPVNVTLQPQKKTKVHLSVTASETGRFYILGYKFKYYKFLFRQLLSKASEEVVNFLVNFKEGTYIDESIFKMGAVCTVDIIDTFPLLQISSKIISIRMDSTEILENSRQPREEFSDSILLIQLKCKISSFISEIFIEPDLPEESSGHQPVYFKKFLSQNELEESFSSESICKYCLIPSAGGLKLPQSPNPNIPLQLSHDIPNSFSIRVEYTDKSDYQFLRRITLPIQIKPESNPLLFPIEISIFQRNKKEYNQLLQSLINNQNLSSKLSDNLFNKIMETFNSTSSNKLCGNFSTNNCFSSISNQNYDNNPLKIFQTNISETTSLPLETENFKVSFEVYSQPDQIREAHTPKIFTIKITCHITTKIPIGIASIFLVPLVEQANSSSSSTLYFGSLERHFNDNHNFNDSSNTQTSAYPKGVESYEQGFHKRSSKNLLSLKHSVDLCLTRQFKKSYVVGLFLWQKNTIYWYFNPITVQQVPA